MIYDTAFTFYARNDKIKEWRLYRQAKGLKLKDFGSAAMDEYMKRHPLTAKEKKLYDLLEDGE